MDGTVRIDTAGGQKVDGDAAKPPNLPFTYFIRTKTLCQGGDYRDLKFVCHNTDAGDAWTRTERI